MFMVHSRRDFTHGALGQWYKPLMEVAPSKDLQVLMKKEVTEKTAYLLVSPFSF